MFEQSVVGHEVSGARSVVSLPVSIGFHAGAVVLAIFAAVWHIDFPASSPAQIEQFRIPPIVIPIKSPEQTTRPHTQSQPKPVVAQNQTPTVIPDTIIPAQPIAQPDNGLVPTTTDVGPTGDDGFSDGPPSTGTGLGNDVGESPLVPGGDVKPPIAITRVDPPYPALAIKMRWDGYVIIRSIIDRDGNIIDASVLRSTNPVFEKPALDSVVRWKFKPGTLYGKPVATIFTLTVTFKVRS